MEQFFNVLTASARLDKSQKRLKREIITQPATYPEATVESSFSSKKNDTSSEDENQNQTKYKNETTITMKTKKRKFTAEKEQLIHIESIRAFRNKMGIRLSTDSLHDMTVPDPISSFDGISQPEWWHRGLMTQTKNSIVKGSKDSLYHNLHSTIVRNIERGLWINPTPIQMQAIPSLLDRRDMLGCAPTGSGKSGAFLIPTLILSSCPENIFFNSNNHDQLSDPPSKKHKQNSNSMININKPGGGIRGLILAPSRELAQQLYREAIRLGEGKVGGVHVLLLSKSNVGSLLASSSSGESPTSRGWDILISTPLRLVECIEGKNSNAHRKLDLSRVRIIILDEADRLLDCSDGGSTELSSHNSSKSDQKKEASGSTHTRTFLSQIDAILAATPCTATRALFSATIGPSVRQFSESILRNPIDVTILQSSVGVNTYLASSSSNNVLGTAVASSSSSAALGVNTNVRQSLQFVGNEEGKLLAIRQLIQKGFHPPALVFLQSQERAQALYEELLYDKVRVDVLHAGRSQAARDKAVTLFRTGETWILICTDLCARGIDFKAANLVVNYDMPEDGICYVHRIGTWTFG